MEAEDPLARNLPAREHRKPAVWVSIITKIWELWRILDDKES